MDYAPSLVGSALSYYGAKKANATNVKLAREAMAFSRESQHQQMGFQERMSNTSYQRAMQDMRQAGLNPILALNSGGASSPSGSAPGGQGGHVGNEFAGAVASAIDARRAVSELRNLQAQNGLIEAQTEAARQAAKTSAVSAEKTAGVDTMRGWMDVIKDVAPWLVFAATRGRSGSVGAGRALTRAQRVIQSQSKASFSAFGKHPPK